MAGHWEESLATTFVDEAYETVKGRVRTAIIHEQLLDHLGERPATILDIGGGAGNQSLPLARAGHRLTLLDLSPAMRARAEERLAHEDQAVQERTTVLAGSGEDASAATGGATFDAVICHGVLMYVDDPAPLLRSIVASMSPGGLVSLLALNAHTLAVRPALERRWGDALTALSSEAGARETGVLGTDTRADTVEDLSARLEGEGVAPVAWYGGWLWSDWLELDPADPTTLAEIIAVEASSARQEPYRSLSRVFHLVGRKDEAPS